jgi:hypothetical protein
MFIIARVDVLKRKCIIYLPKNLQSVRILTGWSFIPVIQCPRRIHSHNWAILAITIWAYPASFACHWVNTSTSPNAICLHTLSVNTQPNTQIAVVISCTEVGVAFHLQIIVLHKNRGITKILFY